MSVPYFGDFPEDHTHVIIPINTFSSNDPSASVTVTNLLNTDVHIHKDGAVAQRNNAAGITMTVDFDGITGNHVLIIDTSDNTVAGFYVTGKEYQVRIEGATVDAGAINAFVGAFSIERAGGTIALLKLIQAAVITNAAGADVAADIIAVKAETATIVNDTDVIDDGTSGLVKIASDVAAVLVDTAVIGALGVGLTAITDDTEDIQARIPAALSSGNIKADMLAISASSTAADNLEASALGIVVGTVNTGNVAATTTTFQSGDITEATADHFIGRIVIFYDSGDALFRQATDITDYTWDAGNSEAVFTVTVLTSAPADADKFVIV